MNEKPEAFCEVNYEILRVTNSGEFIWNENADQMICDPVFTEANPAIIYVVRALRQAEVIRQENERLKAERDEAVKAEREACAKVCDDHRRLDADLQRGIWVLGSAITLAAAIRARGEVPR